LRVDPDAMMRRAPGDVAARITKPAGVIMPEIDGYPRANAMTEWEHREGASEPEVHSFVLRARRDPQPGPRSARALRIRLERVEPHQVWHFDNIASALDELRISLEHIAGNTPT
jgi:hypothetical protein